MERAVVLLAASNAVLLLQTACTGSPPSISEAALVQQYDEAIRDAAVRSPGSDVVLKPLPASATEVRVATFTEWPAPTSPLQRYTWVTLPDELRAKCQDKQDSILAIEEILGLPPARKPFHANNAWKVVTFTAPRAYIFRPCLGNTDVSARKCPTAGLQSRLDPKTMEFLLRQLWSSHIVGFENAKPRSSEFGHPFTGMGWTYDWDPNSHTHVGVSEYVVRSDAPVSDVVTTEPAPSAKNDLNGGGANA